MSEEPLFGQEVGGLRHLRQTERDRFINDGYDNVYIGDVTNGISLWMGKGDKAVLMSIPEALSLARQITAAVRRVRNAG